MITCEFDLIGISPIGFSKHIESVKTAAEGHDDFEQNVDSMQLDHKDVKSGKKGDVIAIKVDNPVHKNDKVLVVKK